MVDTKLRLATSVLLLLLAACQPTENAAKPTANSSKPADTPTNIAEGGRAVMDKVKTVEGQLQQGADRTRKADDEQK
jgi:hypothetical protein